jgi:hypothetical protein
MAYRARRIWSRQKRGDRQHPRHPSLPRESRRQDMAVAGKRLAGAGLSGIVAYVAASAGQHSWPFWPYWVFIGMLAVGVVLYYVSRHHPDAPGKVKLPRPVARRVARPGRGQPRQAVAARWRHVPAGAEPPGLVRAVHQDFAHTGCVRSASGTRPPSVRIAIRVAVGPLGSTPTTADLRDSLLGFLRQPPTSRLLRSLTYSGGDLAWRLHDGDGRLRNEAVLAGREQARETPAAVAIMTLSDDGALRDGSGLQTAELVLHIEPRDDHGDPAPPAGFEAWYESLDRALVIPDAFAQFLRHDVDVMTYDDPPVEVAVQFRAGHNLSELIDTGGVRPLPGSRPSDSFLGCMTAGRGGQAPAGAITDMLIRVCDHALHLENGYEDALARLQHER